MRPERSICSVSYSDPLPEGLSFPLSSSFLYVCIRSYLSVVLPEWQEYLLYEYVTVEDAGSSGAPISSYHLSSPRGNW